MPSPSTEILWPAVVAVTVIFAIGAAFVSTIFFGQRRHIKSQQAVLARLQDEVAERTQAERYLREAEEKYRGIFENSVEGIFQISPEGRFISVNPAFAQIFGFESPAKVIESSAGTAVQAIAPGLDLVTLGSPSANGDTVTNYETRSHRVDGKRIWISINSRKVRDASSRTMYYEGTVEDISQRKHAEQVQRDLAKYILEAQEAERKRVAFDLHDSVNQMLSSVRYRLKSAEEESRGARRSTWKGAEESRMLVEKAIQELKRISRNLRPTTLDDLGLVAAARTLGAEFTARTGITVQVESSGMKRRLPADLELALFRIVQEALNNVEKHSQATKVEVSFALSGPTAIATVVDDGKGFNPTKVNHGGHRGLGLVSMNERATLLGGTVTIESIRRKGTRVVAHIPVNNQR